MALHAHENQVQTHKTNMFKYLVKGPTKVELGRKQETEATKRNNLKTVRPQLPSPVTDPYIKQGSQLTAASTCNISPRGVNHRILMICNI